MRKSVGMLVVAGLVLGGCGGWRDLGVNPRNWFGKPKPVAVASADGAANPLIPAARKGGIFSRPAPEDRSELVGQVTKLTVDRTPTGAIVLVEGLASRQGGFATTLKRLPEDPENKGVLTLEFRITYPKDATPVGTEHQRRITEALTLSQAKLKDVRTIRVLAAGNAMETKRR